MNACQKQFKRGFLGSRFQRVESVMVGGHGDRKCAVLGSGMNGEGFLSGGRLVGSAQLEPDEGFTFKGLP